MLTANIVKQPPVKYEPDIQQVTSDFFNSEKMGK